MVEHLDAISADALERFVRLAERVAALPADVQANITEDVVTYIVENDTDYPFN
jgi:hypothetical protein